jgi:hypothetical protein
MPFQGWIIFLRPFFQAVGLGYRPVARPVLHG